MAIKYINQDIITAKAGVIIHQCNCQGIMETPIAKQVKDKLLSESQFNKYKYKCMYQGGTLLGKVFWCPLPDKRLVANLFGQGKSGGIGRRTSYTAVQEGLERIERKCRERDIETAAMPYKMGCSPGGGQWDYMLEEVIKPVFIKSPVTLYICKCDEKDLGRDAIQNEAQRLIRKITESGSEEQKDIAYGITDIRVIKEMVVFMAKSCNHVD